MRAFDPAGVSLADRFLIEASAGTGKTYTITSLFIRLVLAGYPVSDILVVTFTEAATAELKHRIRSRLHEALAALRQGNCEDAFLHQVLGNSDAQKAQAVRQVTAALSSFDEAAIWTIHGFCRRVLQEHAFESGAVYDMELVADQLPLYQEVAADLWAGTTSSLPAPWIRLLQDKLLNPARLVPFLTRILGRPDFKLIPDSQVPVFDPLVFEKIYDSARAIWAADQKEIKTLLTSHPGINRQSYNKRNLPNWLSATEDYLSMPNPARFPDDNAGIARFSQSRLLDFHNRMKKDPPQPRHRFFEAVDDLCRYSGRWLIAFQRQLIDDARQILSRRKQDLGVVFFDDLIGDLDRALQGPAGEHLAAGIRSRFAAALIDEFQDTDLLQYRIFNRIFQGGSRPFFLIGDPKQSIYAFRGADIFAYFKAARDTGDRVGTLDVNWRSDPSLIGAVNTLFGRVANPFLFPQVRFSPVKARTDAVNAITREGKKTAALQVLFLSRQDAKVQAPALISKGWINENLPGKTAAEISDLLTGDARIEDPSPRLVAPKDVAVLVRTNRQARLMQSALRELAIPSVISGADSVFESTEAFELWQVLGAAADPSDIGIRNALQTQLFGLPACDIDVLGRDDRAWTSWVIQFRNWHRLWHSDGFMPMISDVFSGQTDTSTTPRLPALLRRVDGRRQVTNFQHLAELLHGAALDDRLGMAGLMQWFQRRRSGDGPASDTHELRLESDEQTVRLVTIHKSKGLEYPVVFLPYLWEGDRPLHHDSGLSFHDPADGFRPTLDLGSEKRDSHEPLARQEANAENCRLLYVALTRARHHCVVVWGAVKGFETSSLFYLLHNNGETAGDFGEPATTLSDVDIAKDLSTLADESNGTIAVRALSVKSGQAYEPTAESGQSLACRKQRRTLEPGWRVASYSHLVSSATAPQLAPEPGQDHDQTVEARRPEPEKSALQGPLVPLAEFERSAGAGTFFHTLLEHIDFQETDASRVSDLVDRNLASHGFETGRWHEPVLTALSDIVSCGLDRSTGLDRTSGLDRKNPELSLDRICVNNRLNELEFIFPVAHGKDTPAQRPVTGRQLVALFQQYCEPGIPQSYQKALSRLTLPSIQGYFKGFIDLVFVHQGRWYVIDYKSNFLGARLTDYGPDHLAAAMCDHHYILQYHLYVTAVHKYLSGRIEDYNYETHFGKVYYLFLRGMSPSAGPGSGVFQDRPPEKLIRELSNLLG
ncbi:MAG: exodeoxyribonuclease V subunit beta [Deltaproteobacteria bacterium]|nr:exodeoxyribonuclease V subunit beta [Deltaproteobacteria bacterium]